MQQPFPKWKQGSKQRASRYPCGCSSGYVTAVAVDKSTSTPVLRMNTGALCTRARERAAAAQGGMVGGVSSRVGSTNEGELASRPR